MPPCVSKSASVLKLTPRFHTIIHGSSFSTLLAPPREILQIPGSLSHFNSTDPLKCNSHYISPLFTVEDRKITSSERSQIHVIKESTHELLLCGVWKPKKKRQMGKIDDIPRGIREGNILRVVSNGGHESLRDIAGGGVNEVLRGCKDRIDDGLDGLWRPFERRGCMKWMEVCE